MLIYVVFRFPFFVFFGFALGIQLTRDRETEAKSIKNRFINKCHLLIAAAYPIQISNELKN